MNGGALGLVLTAALLHAIWNFAAKRVQGSGPQFVFLYACVSAAVCLPIAVIDVIVQGQQPHLIWLLAAFVTAAAHVLYGIALQYGYTVGDLSIVYRGR